MEKSGKKPILITLAVILFTLILAQGIFYFYQKYKPANSKQSAENPPTSITSKIQDLNIGEQRLVDTSKVDYVFNDGLKKMLGTLITEASASIATEGIIEKVEFGSFTLNDGLTYAMKIQISIPDTGKSIFSIYTQQSLDKAIIIDHTSTNPAQIENLTPGKIIRIVTTYDLTDNYIEPTSLIITLDNP